jgi:hypothetical protein
MSYDEVVRVLGRPVLIETFVGSGSDLVATTDPMHAKVLLDYSFRVFRPAYTPEVYVALDNGRVSYVRVNYRAPFGLGHGGVFQTPGRNDSTYQWNMLVPRRDRKKALAELYDDFGEELPDAPSGNVSQRPSSK